MIAVSDVNLFTIGHPPIATTFFRKKRTWVQLYMVEFRLGIFETFYMTPKLLGSTALRRFYDERYRYVDNFHHLIGLHDTPMSGYK